VLRSTLHDAVRSPLVEAEYLYDGSIPVGAGSYHKVLRHTESWAE
jgi:hypothetical protein